MEFNRAFSSIMERKEDKYVSWEHIYELWTLQKKTSKFNEFNSFYGYQ